MFLIFCCFCFVDNAKLYCHFTQIACYFYLDYNHVLKFGYTYGLKSMIKKQTSLLLKKKKH